MTRQEKIQRIKGLIKQGAKVQTKPYDFPDVEEWKEQVRLALNKIFVNDSYVNQFNSYFKKRSIRLSVDRERQYQSHHQKNMGNAIAFLKVKLGEFIDWDNEPKDENNTASNSIVDSKSPKIFISHATADAKYAEQLVDLLNDAGIPIVGDHIFCSSIPGQGISLRKRIYDTLKEQFDKFDLLVIFLLSENYYKSPACLNEMGATWILDRPHYSILLPGFDFSKIAGAADPMEMSIKLDDENARYSLNDLRDQLKDFFQFKPTSTTHWERKKDEFIKAVMRNATNSNKTIKNGKDVIPILDNVPKAKQRKELPVLTQGDNITPAQVIQRFFNIPKRWKEHTFTGNFKAGYYTVQELSDWYCEKLGFECGMGISSFWEEIESGIEIEIYVDEDLADKISDITSLSEVTATLTPIYLEYENDYGRPDDQKIFRVDGISNVKPWTRGVPPENSEEIPF